MLALAGTSNLEAALGRANASFRDRGELFPLGRLSPEEAGQAVTAPLEEAIARGMASDDESVTHDRIMDKFDQLFHPGYAWQVGGDDYEPGIPNLVSCVHGNSPG